MSIAYFVVISSVFKTQMIWDRFLHSSIWVSVAVFGYSVLQLMDVIRINQGGVRIDGPFGNASYLAMFALIHVFLSLYFAFKNDLDV